MAFFSSRKILERLAGLDVRLARIETRLDSLAREDALRAELARKQRELDAQGEQSLVVIDRLDEAKRRILELEKGRGP